jgi:hypothetical protein
MARRRPGGEAGGEVIIAVGGPRAPAASAIAKPGIVLDLVDETADEDLNTDALHAALAALLIRHYQKNRERLPTTGS